MSYLTLFRFFPPRNQPVSDGAGRIEGQDRAVARLANALAHHGGGGWNETVGLELEEADEPAGEVAETFRIGDDVLLVGVRRVAS